MIGNYVFLDKVIEWEYVIIWETNSYGKTTLPFIFIFNDDESNFISLFLLNYLFISPLLLLLLDRYDYGPIIYYLND